MNAGHVNGWLDPLMVKVDDPGHTLAMKDAGGFSPDDMRARRGEATTR
jgi:hypothetical protein